MVKVLFIAMGLLLALPLCAQKNDLSLFAVGNLNGGSKITLNSQGGTPVAVNYRSSIGGAAQYNFWIASHVGGGIWSEAVDAASLTDEERGVMARNGVNNSWVMTTVAFNY